MLHRDTNGSGRNLNDLNPYLHGPYAPVGHEITATNLDVIGEIPADINGTYYRTGPNPRTPPAGMHHWFDGDGMVHAIHLENGNAEYRNRYVRSRDFVADMADNLSRGGIFHPAQDDGCKTVYKDTGNTDIICHNGTILGLWYISGQPVRIDPHTLETIDVETFGDTLPGNVSAHSKVDSVTGEFLFFDYALYEPWYSFGVVDRNNTLTHFTRIELPGPRLPHDMAITERYAILMDMPIVFTQQGLRNKVWHIHQDCSLPTRFGVLGRDAPGDTIKWFTFPPCYIYHVVNAWEEGDEVIMLACKMVDNGLPIDPAYGPYGSMVDVLTLRAHLFEWRMNMKTGQGYERQLDDSMSEFPAVNLGLVGRKTRHAYHGAIADVPLQAFDGILKYDLSTGTSERHAFRRNVYGSEPAFAPREHAKGEDDGYVVTFATDRTNGQSEALIIDAQNMTGPPLARVQIPQRVPLGFHATWVNTEEMTPVKNNESDV